MKPHREPGLPSPFWRGVGGGGAGRICPADYRYSVSALNRWPDFSASVLYVVGGLY